LYRIFGQLTDSRGTAVSRLRVEAWDTDLLFDDLVGSAVSDSRGQFLIEFTEKRFRECVADRDPELFFRILLGDREIRNMGDSVLRNIKDPDSRVTVRVDLPVVPRPMEPGKCGA
jgi:hypothetical protein